MRNRAEDRAHFGWTIPEYTARAEALSMGGWVNRKGDFFKIKNLKNKKLRNLRHQMKMSQEYEGSPLMTEYYRQLEAEGAYRKMWGTWHRR